ncbi:MAG: 3'(2'),5'-bisphosphate nucleotidase CysQ [Endozoicomonas sp. (ex Botrylloides leachii)]|nr:3'(2'),5'-bisphosphate nucleotidase CysQ [Endozoicomonas sp. (ex Botrylloides leachii)]
MTTPVNESMISAIKHIAHQAGQAILDVYGKKQRSIKEKPDQTPVTEADLLANEIILAGLNAVQPHYPILSEESAHQPLAQRKRWQRHWLVDPLDGTQEFINRNGQFTVNIALMEANYPILGIVYAPTTHTFYWGGEHYGSFRQEKSGEVKSITTRRIAKGQKITTLGSRSYSNSASNKFIEKLHSYFESIQFFQVGSSLKGCKIAEGSADIYPRLGPTSEWDTAAVQAIIEGAGGSVLNRYGRRFKYNYKESLTNDIFVMLGDPKIDWHRFWNLTNLPDITK